ncbi:hypothetical protein NC653_037509 [Populus alba x Populus x berolinensis]|uniref:Uncharacterized protein n=1 Tax=Populus alba x Populus x berolinensis TaxID=444605 RepID=A0AAD6PS57_9ROSI|nr:hypothetical protein NC653_037509 [Populus alba x Populus x berolinensis]
MGGWLSTRCLPIQCYCLRISPEQREDLIDEACEAFRKMEEDGCPPDVCLCLPIQCYCLRISPEQREDLIDEACKAFRKMEEDGCPPDVCPYNVIV